MKQLEHHKKLGINREIHEAKRSLDGLYTKDYLKAGQGSRNSFNLTSNQNLNSHQLNNTGDNSQINIHFTNHNQGSAYASVGVFNNSL